MEKKEEEEEKKARFPLIHNSSSGGGNADFLGYLPTREYLKYYTRLLGVQWEEKRKIPTYLRRRTSGKKRTKNGKRKQGTKEGREQR